MFVAIEKGFNLFIGLMATEPQDQDKLSVIQVGNLFCAVPAAQGGFYLGSTGIMLQNGTSTSVIHEGDLFRVISSMREGFHVVLVLIDGSSPH